MTNKMWSCYKCKQKYRDLNNYKENLGIQDSLRNKYLCIKCYNEGIDLE